MLSKAIQIQFENTFRCNPITLNNKILKVTVKSTDVKKDMIRKYFDKRN